MEPNKRMPLVEREREREILSRDFFFESSIVMHCHAPERVILGRASKVS